MKAIVILNNVPWGFLCDYIEQNSKQLAQKNKVVIFNPFYFPTFKNLLFDARKRLEWLSLFKEKEINYFPTFGYIPFQRFSLVKEINVFLNFLLLRLYLAIKFSDFKLIFWTFSIETTDLISFLRSDEFLIYDRPDHLASVDQDSDQKIKLKERILIKRADLVLTNSILSLNYVKKFNKNSYLMPWGYAEKIFAKKNLTCPADLKKISSPRLGFIGHINHRVDLKLLYSLAGNNKDWNFIMVGPIFEYDPVQSEKTDFFSWFRKTKEINNIFYLGEKPKALMPNYIKFFDVCLIPYDYSQEFVQGCNPMKFYEYLSLGKPVVSVPIAALKYFPSTVVGFAKSSLEFEKQIKRFLRVDSSKNEVRSRLKIAAENSWEKRIDKIWEILDREDLN